MSLLTKTEYFPLINSGDQDQIYIDPFLDDIQLGSVSFDLRLGGDFLVSVQTRRPSIKIADSDDLPQMDMFFQESRRDLGDPFLIYPNQTVLATSLEYVGLPNNVYADVIGRSSYNRLGVGVGAMFQPGYRGCISLELYNHSNNPIELIVGSRVVQLRFYKLDNPEEYLGGEVRRKYIGNVRPVAPRANRDADLSKIVKMRK